MPLASPTSSRLGSMIEHLGDESVCELLEVGLGMLARARLSEGLRNSAQSCVQAIVRACFARLKTLTPADVERLLQAGLEDRGIQPKGKQGEEGKLIQNINDEEEESKRLHQFHGLTNLFGSFQASFRSFRFTDDTRTLASTNCLAGPFRSSSYRLNAFVRFGYPEHGARSRRGESR